jgi:hypothetical protein
MEKRPSSEAINRSHLLKSFSLFMDTRNQLPFLQEPKRKQKNM